MGRFSVVIHARFYDLKNGSNFRELRKIEFLTGDEPNRVGTKVNGVWRYMVYDARGKLVAEYGEAANGMGGVKFVQQDWQGSVRTVTNNNGFAVARTDHQAFGGEIGYGVGQASVDKGYNQDPATRQGYAMTERDERPGPHLVPQEREPGRPLDQSGSI